MDTRRRLALLVLLVALGSPGPGGAATAAEAAPRTRAELVMGTIARITLADPAAAAVFEAGFAAMRRVDAAMSLYRQDSDLVRVNVHAARHAEPVDPELFDCLTRARALSEVTDGAFDPTILPLLRAWGAYRELDYLPVGRVEAVGWGGLQLDPAARAVRFDRDGMGVDLGAIAKGYALDRARAAVLAAGAARGLIDLGGDLVLIGAGAAGGAWRIAVRDPSDPEGSVGTLVLDPGLSVSTSGNYARDFAAEGWRTRSHVYDPRTGRAVAPGLAVTVWSPDATAADALSTAFLVLGPSGVADVLRRRPDVGALFVDDSASERRIVLVGDAPRAFERSPSARGAVTTAKMESPE